MSASGKDCRPPAEKAGQAQFRASGGFVGWGHGLVLLCVFVGVPVAVSANNMKLRQISEKANDFPLGCARRTGRFEQ